MLADNESREMSRTAVGPFSYNAVKLSPAEVARTFVAPEYFQQLVQSDNAILVGPRGSGKTTLLKMLQSEALERWQSPNAELAASEVRSTGVFVGADRLWSEQLSASSGINKDLVGMAAYSSHIALSLSRAMEYRVRGNEEGASRKHLRVVLARSAEREIASSFVDYFRLGKSAYDFDGVRRAVHGRLVELGQLRQAIRRGTAEVPSWLEVDPLSAVRALTMDFNDYVGQPGHRWSLLFDELELAPRGILEDLLSQLRGGAPHLNYKLSLVPVVGQSRLLGGEFGAVEGQDVDYISLTDASRFSASRFTKSLLEHQLASRVPPINVTPHRILGDSAFDSADSSGPGARLSSAYAPGGLVWEAMKRLRESDTSFANYLSRSQIDLNSLTTLSPDQRAAKVRKMRNVVVVRDYYRMAGRRRSRKSLELYSGAATVLALPDGNPRMAMALIRELFSKWDRDSSNTISPSAQGEAIEIVLNRFVALLAAQEAERIGGSASTVLQLVDNIGSNLATRVLDGNFSPDVPAAFKVDADVDQRLYPLIERAVNAGAFVPVRSSGAENLSASVAEQTYRLSYLLAPRFGLPIRAGKSVALSNLLTAGSGLFNTSRLQPALPGFDD